ncbi:MAG: KTSC domain-containing protein [Flavobacteriales bacterium]
MKKIIDSRKLFGANVKTDLKELASAYKGLMKTHHPDKFHDNPELKLQAEETSKHIIDAYHFLVSIHPETHAQATEEYERVTGTLGIDEFHYKSQTLHITFVDGSAYEYYDVPNNVYNKFLNTEPRSRFARRHIFHTFVRRQVKKPTAV